MRGAPARAIQDLAGHQDLSTTQRYMLLMRLFVLCEDPRVEVYRAYAVNRQDGRVELLRENRVACLSHLLIQRPPIGTRIKSELR